MPGKTKQVVLFIAEGASEENALEPVLAAIFDRAEVRFHLVHGDLTFGDWTPRGAASQGNIVSRVGGCVKRVMDQYRLEKKDFLSVVHLIDTDGAFVPGGERNERKTAVVKRLCATPAVMGIPYAVYYFSRNLEHVLFDDPRALTPAQKAAYADACADRYERAPDAFVRLLAQVAPAGGYDQSWAFILDGEHSLGRYSNLATLME